MLGTRNDSVPRSEVSPAPISYESAGVSRSLFAERKCVVAGAGTVGEELRNRSINGGIRSKITDREVIARDRAEKRHSHRHDQARRSAENRDGNPGPPRMRWPS